MYKLTLSICLLLMLGTQANAQTIYVDAINGKENAKGSATDPFLSLEKAIKKANSFTGNDPVTIKLAPGLYVIAREQVVETQKTTNDNARFTIEAINMPDDASWQPAKMPVIQSVSPNNSNVQFTHCVAFLVAKNNVSFKGA